MTQFMSGFVAAPALGGGFVQPVMSGFVQPGAREADTDMFGVFVGDLPQDANEQDLIKLFTTASLPVVKCKIIRDMDNNSKRYGFVHFPTEELRQKAIIEMHGATLKGQTINVRTQHYKETDRCLVKTGTKKTDIYIGNIPRTLSKYQVREAVADWQLPKVQDVKVFKNDTGMFCFISFLTEAEVQAVMEDLKAHPKTLAGRELLVQSSGTSITSTLNAELLQRLPRNEEEQHIIRSLQLLKNALGGDSCPLNDRQLGLLEKSQRTLYVRNLHPNTNEAALSQKFNKYGKLRKVIIVTDKDTKVPMGYGFVEFYSVHACSRAALDDECELDGQLLTLQVSRPPKDIHAIITAAGLTDASGNLLGPYTTQALSQPQPQYFQDPTTGQLFIGDGAHYGSYLANGYAPVNMDYGFTNLYPPTMMVPQMDEYPPRTKEYPPRQRRKTDSVTTMQQMIQPQVQFLQSNPLMGGLGMQQNPMQLQNDQLQQLLLQQQLQQMQQHPQAAQLQQQQLLQLQQQQLQVKQEQYVKQEQFVKQEGVPGEPQVQPMQIQQPQQQQQQQIQPQQQTQQPQQQPMPLVKSEPFVSNVKTEQTGSTTSPTTTPQNTPPQNLQQMQTQLLQNPALAQNQMQNLQQVNATLQPNALQAQLQQQALHSNLQQHLQKLQQQQQAQQQTSLQTQNVQTQQTPQTPLPQHPNALQQAALQQQNALNMQQNAALQATLQQNALNLQQQQNAWQLHQQQLNLQQQVASATALPQVVPQQPNGLVYQQYAQRFAPY